MAKETNLTALNEIAEKCGGTAQASNAKAIKEIADNFSGGGGGGGDIFEVILFPDPENPSEMITTTTTAQAQAAWDAGKQIRILVKPSADVTTYDMYVSAADETAWSASIVNQDALLSVLLFKSSDAPDAPMGVGLAVYELTPM